MRSRTNSRASKVLGVAALMLGLVLASPGSVSARAGGTDRPVQGTDSGTVRLNLATRAFVAEVTGHMSHLGRGSARVEGTGAFLPDSTFAGNGEMIVVASNGDELHGSSVLTTSPFTPQAVEHTTTQVVTINGGTGRFEDATGTLTIVSDITPIGVEGATIVNRVEGTTRGQISY